MEGSGQEPWPVGGQHTVLGHLSVESKCTVNIIGSLYSQNTEQGGMRTLQSAMNLCNGCIHNNNRDSETPERHAMCNTTLPYISNFLICLKIE